MTTAEGLIVPQTELVIPSLWQPQFPSAEMVSTASALLPAVVEPVGGVAEGPRWEVVTSPGALQVRTRDWARQDRTAQRDQRRHRIDADQLAAYVHRTRADQVSAFVESNGRLPECDEWPTGQLPAKPPPRRQITEWTRRSRARMVQRLCELEYSPLFADPTRLPAMLTLTYPGDWLTVAPDGAACYGHLTTLAKRYEREWHEPLVGPWKREFQGRDAPHFHLLTSPPHGQGTSTGLLFRQWLSLAWAEVVNHPDSEEFRKHLGAGTRVDYADGLRCTDPKRVAVYFSKHGLLKGKEYQNRVPDAWRQPGKHIGRFWGVLGLKPVRVSVPVSARDGIRAGRLIRRWSRAQGLSRQVIVRRGRGGHRVHAMAAKMIGLACAVQSLSANAAGVAVAAVVKSYQPRYRTSRVRINRLAANRGWVSVNDGAAFTSQVARWLDLANATL